MNPFGDTPIDQTAPPTQTANPFGDSAPVQSQVAPPQRPIAIPQQTEPQPVPQGQPRPQMTPRQVMIAEELKNRGFGDRLLNFFEPVASVASSMVATPVAGIAGLASAPFVGADKATELINNLTSGLTYKPMSQAGKEGMESFVQKVKPIAEGMEKIKTGLGDPVLEATGSPTLATAAYMAPDVLLTYLGLKGLKTVRPGEILKDATGRPTPALKKALNAVDIEYKNLSPEALAVIPTRATPTLIGGSGVDPVMEAVVLKQIQSGVTDNGLAKLMIENTPTGAKLKADKIAAEAVKQGFRDGQVQAIKTMNPETKVEAINMLDILKKTKANERASLDMRPTDIVGNALEKRLLFLRNEVGLAKDELKSIVDNNLQGTQVDTTLVSNALRDAFDDLKIDFKRGDDGDVLRNKNNTPIVDFNTPNSLIATDRSSQRVIRDLVQNLASDNAPDAARLHDLKRILDQMVDYKKKETSGLTDVGKKVIKKVRHSLNETLRVLDDDYARVNDRMSTGINAMDSLDDAVGGIKISGEGSSEGMGQIMRRLMGNAVSRPKIEVALSQIEDATKKLGGQNLVNVKDLTHFDSILNERFGSMAKNALVGQVEQGAVQAARALGQSPSKTAMDVAITLGKKGYEKFKGINDFNAMSSLESLLRR